MFRICLLLFVCMLFFVNRADAQCAGGVCQMQSAYNWAPSQFVPAESYYQTYPTYYTYEPQMQTYSAYQQSQPVAVVPARRYTYRPTFYRSFYRPRFR